MTTPSAKVKSVDTMRVRFRASPKFNRILSKLKQMYDSSSDRDSLSVPYVITCAAALEATLNDALTEYAHTKWGWGETAFSQALLSMSFRSKLNALPPLLTDHKYQFNRSHIVYKRLNALISIRNILVHPKPIDRDLPADKEHQSSVPGLRLPFAIDEYLKHADDLTFGATEQFSPAEYHEALEKLDKWFFRRMPDRISKVALLVANTKA